MTHTRRRTVTKVTLVSHTSKPLETLSLLWRVSRTNVPVDEIQNDVPDIAKLRASFRDFLAAGVPLLENLNFVFVLDNVPISLREQMVRHRIGVVVGDNFGVDIIPELAQSTWWSQTMRVMSMEEFASGGQYLVPETIRDNEEAWVMYESAMGDIELVYTELLNLGIPVEDARQLIPLGATSRISWTLNGGALRHVLGNRSCWIAQYGLWWPVISGMLTELSKVDSVFSEFAAPPCFKAGAYRGCEFGVENERRIQGDDPFPPCPLYMHWQLEQALAYEASHIDAVWNPLPGRPFGATWKCSKGPELVAMSQKMQQQYSMIWPAYAQEYKSYC
jgi:thymidylate synthase ThyX